MWVNISQIIIKKKKRISSNQLPLILRARASSSVDLGRPLPRPVPFAGGFFSPAYPFGLPCFPFRYGICNFNNLVFSLRSSIN